MSQQLSPPAVRISIFPAAFEAPFVNVQVISSNIAVLWRVPAALEGFSMLANSCSDGHSW
jgi:hypothetical protein